MTDQTKGVVNDGQPTPYLHPFARIVRWVDPDTIEAVIGIFDVTVTKAFRLNRVDAPEITLREGTTPEEKAYAINLSEQLNLAMPAGTPIVIQTMKDKKTFERYVAEVWHQGINVNDVIRGNLAGWRGRQ